MAVSPRRVRRTRQPDAPIAPGCWRIRNRQVGKTQRFLIVIFESPTSPNVGFFIFKAESMRTAHAAARGA